ncbi:MAG: hypothetical protein WCL04_10365, partial [Verrucomicrobiota bacterium]
MPTPLPTQRPITSTRSAPQAKKSNLSYVIIAMLLASLGAGGYAWVKLDDRVAKIEAKLAPQPLRAGVTAPGAVTDPNFPNPGGFGGGGGPGGGRGGGRGGRGGLSASTIMQTYGVNLSDAQVTQLDTLLQQRTQLRTAARNDLGDPNAADTSALDNQLVNIVGLDVFSQMQQQLNG